MNTDKDLKSDLNNIGFVFKMMEEKNLNDNEVAILLSAKLKMKLEDLEEHIEKIFDFFYEYCFG